MVLLFLLVIVFLLMVNPLPFDSAVLVNYRMSLSNTHTEKKTANNIKSTTKCYSTLAEPRWSKNKSHQIQKAKSHESHKSCKSQPGCKSHKHHTQQDRAGQKKQLQKTSKTRSSKYAFSPQNCLYSTSFIRLYLPFLYTSNPSDLANQLCTLRRRLSQREAGKRMPECQRSETSRCFFKRFLIDSHVP